MNISRKSSNPSSGFTLVELMVALAVLGLIVALMANVTNLAVITTISSRKHMDADTQARLIFDRIADDFSKMVKYPNVDYIFYKNAAGTSGVNDAMFFYSESPSYDANVTIGSQSPVSLVGYRINSSYQLDRLGQALSYTGATSTAAPGSPVFVAYSSSSNNGATPVSASTLDGNWNSTTGGTAYNIGTSSAANGPYSDGTNANYQTIGEETFRLELNFFLSDGTTSTMPVLSVTPSTWPTSGATTGSSAPAFFHSAGSDPTNTSDGNSANSTYYTIGSRWYNATTSRGYICTNATPNAAVWAPSGTQDISAVIVGIGILDDNSRKLLSASNLSTMAGGLPDAVAGTPISQTWGLSSFLTPSGVPKLAASQIRIYQRYFYLNNQ